MTRCAQLFKRRAGYGSEEIILRLLLCFARRFYLAALLATLVTLVEWAFLLPMYDAYIQAQANPRVCKEYIVWPFMHPTELPEFLMPKGHPRCGEPREPS